jgi:hypothetical protein
VRKPNINKGKHLLHQTIIGEGAERQTDERKLENVNERRYE